MLIARFEIIFLKIVIPLYLIKYTDVYFKIIFVFFCIMLLDVHNDLLVTMTR